MEQLPILNYAGTSGHAGSETSAERAITQDSNGKTREVQAAALAMLAIAADYGMTWAELADAARVHHGTASSALTNLHKGGKIDRIKDRRGRSQIYVLPQHVNGRELAPYSRVKGARYDQNTLNQIGQIVEKQFTPLAFRCACGGGHESCAETLENPTDLANYSQLKRIVWFIQSGKLGELLNEVQNG